MTVTNSRISRLEKMLAESPQDEELRYFIAMEYLKNDVNVGRTKLLQLTEDSKYVPAFLQAGQLLIKEGAINQAKNILQRGVKLAQETNNHHAAGEMLGLLDSID